MSWFEQKAAAVLLTLLSLGIRNIRLGPTLPAFLTPAVVDILVDKFALKPIGDPPRTSPTRWPAPDDRDRREPMDTDRYDVVLATNDGGVHHPCGSGQRFSSRRGIRTGAEVVVPEPAGAGPVRRC